MKPLLTTLLLATLCATGYGQTIKALGYNMTNGNVIGPTSGILQFTNEVTFGTMGGNTVGVFSQLFVGDEATLFFDGGGAGAWRSALGLGWPALTNSNAATSLLGINASNEVVAATNIIFTNGVAFTTNAAASTLANLGLGTNASVTISNLNVQSVNISNADTFRTNIGLGGGLTTNVVVDTNTLVFTNGILLEVTTP
jgi:hypothetical protein